MSRQAVGGDAGLVEGGGFDEVVDGFAWVRSKRPEMNARWVNSPGSARRRRGGGIGEDVIEEDGGAVGSDFYDVFGGVGAGRFGSS